ncbi:hypothetical protein BDN70DRAFT_899772 [Pholiota conissans]|uniref:RNA polymerase II-associated protein 3 n=1 Tax=Pholiota conissans TaxID=109636 RepID=A0A9P5YRJ2_9AGAR|nr:hypothetical protein BDN70DRAFT_899772 [Pholiota conissans]
MSNPKAQAAKDKGNVAFKAGDYPMAIGHYTSAILADGRDPTYPLNRAAAYLKLGKNEDAERDCNTVLNLSSNNVKALFRRGQARVGMEKLLEAQKDFNEVVRVEPANASAQEELKKVAILIKNEKAKKSKAPILPVQASLDPALNTKRRRVPIKIIDASGNIVNTSHQDAPATASTSTTPKSQPQSTAAPAPSPAKSALPTSKDKATPLPVSKSDTLEPISSRSLKPSSGASPETPPVPPAFSAAAAAFKPEEKEPSKGNEKQTPKATTTSFQDAKKARESARPSRAGGGIFRSSGQNTIFASRGGEEGLTKSGIEEMVEVSEEKVKVKTPATSIKSEEPAVGATSAPVAQSPLDTASSTGMKAPATYFDFNRTWHSFRSPEERWALLNTIPPTKLPTLCQTSLEPALLISVLDVFLTLLTAHPGDTALSSKVLEYMQNLARIPRFGTLVLFLSKPEKEVAKGVWGLLGVEPAGSWKAVGY